MPPGAQDSFRVVKHSSPKHVKTPIEKPLTQVGTWSAQLRSFVTIFNHMTNDFSKEELFIAKVEEVRIKTQMNHTHVKLEKYKGEFVDIPL